MKRWKRLRNRRGAECSSRLCTFQRQMKLTALPGIIGVGILYLIPGCALFYYALINNVFQKRFVGLENFTEILSNPYFRLALKNTIFLLGLFLFLTLLLGMILCIPVAFFGWKMTAFSLILLVPLFMPSVLSVGLVEMLGGSWSPRIQLLALFLWRNTGAVFLLLFVGLQSIGQEILDAAKMDGAGRLGTFCYIQLPLVRRYVGVSIVFLIMQFFGIFRESYLLFGTSFPPDEVYLLQHYMYNHFLRLNYPYLAASALLFTLFLVIAVAMARISALAVGKEGRSR